MKHTALSNGWLFANLLAWCENKNDESVVQRLQSSFYISDSKEDGRKYLKIFQNEY